MKTESTLNASSKGGNMSVQIAESRPDEKDIIEKLIVNLINQDNQ